MFALRLIDGIPVDRAQQRFTATYRVDDRLTVGIEVNPLANDVGPLANWRALDETETRPALIFGTSSDRIGSTEGRAVYGTLSKDLEQATGLPVAPYAGLTFGEFEDEWRVIGGLHVRWTERWTSTHLYDGVNIHHLAGRSFGERFRAGGVLVQQDDDYYLGVSFGVSFGESTPLTP